MRKGQWRETGSKITHEEAWGGGGDSERYFMSKGSGERQVAKLLMKNKVSCILVNKSVYILDK